MVRGLLAFALAVLALGCGSGDGTVPVTGTVTFDGQPFGDGSDAVIRFDPEGTAGNSAESFVTNGAYAVKLVPGPYKVSVRWSKASGKKRSTVAGPGAESEAAVQVLPAKYNDGTELKATVSKDAAKHDFTLVK